MTVDETDENSIKNIVNTLSEKLFANTVIEEYSFKILEDKENA